MALPKEERYTYTDYLEQDVKYGKKTENHGK